MASSKQCQQVTAAMPTWTYNRK